MKYLLTIVLLFSFNQARAVQGYGYVSGNMMLEVCEMYLGDATAVNIARGNECVGYLAGITGAHRVFVDWKLMERGWCLPKDVEIKQLARVVTKYLQENPQELHLDAGGLVVTAIGIAFPCE